MVFIQSIDRKGRYEFRSIQKSCKMRSVYKNQIRAKQENNDTCKSVIHTQQSSQPGEEQFCEDCIGCLW